MRTAIRDELDQLLPTEFISINEPDVEQKFNAYITAFGDTDLSRRRGNEHCTFQVRDDQLEVPLNPLWCNRR